MKANTLIFFFFSLFLSITSCSNELYNKPKQHTAMSSINPYDFIGEIHNAAMDSVKSKNILSEELKMFTNKYTQIHFDSVQTYNQPVLCEATMNNIIQTSCAYKYNTRSTEAIEDSVLLSVPQEIRPYMEKLYEIVDYSFVDSIQLKATFQNFDSLIISNQSLDAEERACILAVSAIAKYSSLYNFSTVNTRSITAKGIIKSDLGGALTGVLCWATFGKAACSGLMFGPGGVVLTIAKEATRGAIIGSATHIVTGGFF